MFKKKRYFLSLVIFLSLGLNAEDSFIGSDSIIVAPVNIGKNAVTAAGSVITEDVNDNQIAFGRARQINKERGKD